MIYEFRGKQISLDDPLMESLREYVESGYPMGHFLTAVVENDLQQAIGRADSHSLDVLPVLVGWLYNQAPSGCFGSPSKVREWLSHKGLRGLAR